MNGSWKEGKESSGHGRCPGREAQSEVVGLVTVFGIIFISISIILLAGIPLLEDARENAQTERFKSEFGLLNQQIRESVYAPGQSSASVSPSNGRVSVDDGSDSLTVKITYRPDTGPPVSTGDMRLGGVEFDAGGGRGVIYEGGGVWTKTRSGISLSTPPGISHTGGVLNMDLINFTTSLAASGNTESTFYFSSEGTHTSDRLRKITNSSLEPGELEVSVRSEMEQGWAEYFNRTLAEGSGAVEMKRVSSPDERGFANVTVRTGPPLYSIENALNHSGNTITDVDIDPDNEVNVTDSSVGDFVLGNYTGTELGSNNGPPSGIDDLPDAAGLCFRSFDGEDLGSAASPVKSGTYETDTGSDISGGTFVADGGDLRIHADTTVNLGSPTTFDTSGGDVEVHVDGRLNLNSDVEVNGTNSVYFYVKDRVEMAGGATVTIEDGRSERLQVLTSGGADIANADYRGAVYAQDGIDIQPDASVTGAAVSADRLRMIGSPPGNNADYAHDTALRGTAPDCAGGPLRSLNAFERRIAVR